MAGRRLAAFVGAVLLVVAAVAVRRWIDSGGEVSLGGAPSPVHCDPLVADACRAAFEDRQVIIEQPGLTLDRLLDDRENSSLLWVTSSLWFDILDAERTRLGRTSLIESTSAALAHTEVFLVAEASAEDDCGGVVTWACLADGQGGLEIGLDSRQSTVGLFSQGALVGAFVGSPSYATNDLGPSYGQWRSSLAGSVEELSTSRTALDQMLTVRGQFDVVSASQVQWEGLSREGFIALAPSDAGPQIVMAMAAIGTAGGSADDLATELVGEGWASGPGVDRPGPSPGVYEALRRE